MQYPNPTVARAIGSAALCAALLTVAGCTPDKPTAIAMCENETMRFYSGLGGDDFMIACMEAKGYRFEVLPEDCDSRTRMVRQPSCYVPIGWLAAFLDGIGRPANPKPTASNTDVKAK